MATSLGSGQHELLIAGSDILSDARIEELLQEAESRLRAKVQLEPESTLDKIALKDTSSPSDSAKRIRLQKLQHGVDRSLYLKNENGITRMNTTLMVPDEQRKMADGLRETARGEEHKKIVCHTLSSTRYFQEEI